MTLQIYRSDTPIALMQLLTDLPPLQHGDLTFNMNVYMYQCILYGTIYSFLNMDILNTIT